MAPEVERKLAAILSADVVDYSRLMAEDEAGTVRTLTAYREQIGTLVREHRGRAVSAHYASASCTFLPEAQVGLAGRPYVLVRGRQHPGCI